MKNIFLLLLTLQFVHLHAQKPVDKRLAGLDTMVARVLKDYKAPGVSIAVVEKNKIVYTGGFGYRDLANKLPVTENTLFAIGSCTKAFTASMLGQMVNDGALDLDKPVRNYLPELKFYNEYLNDHVTIRDMMTHRTGLPRHDYSWYGSTATRNELLKRIEYLQPSAELREKYQYNNFMFMSQGVLLEKLTGKSWEANIKERIFDPLGMSQTVTTMADLEKSADRSLAYALIRDSFAMPIPYRNIDNIGPAGAINSSAKDMAKWLITWINDGKYNGKEIVPASFRNQAISIQMANGTGPNTEFPAVTSFGYGLAWTVGTYRGHYRVEHGGGIDGFITTTGFFPNDSIGIFVCSADGNISSPIRNWIADRMLNLPYQDWHGHMRDAFVKEKFAALMQPIKIDSTTLILNTKPSAPISQYTGKYTNKGYGTIEITETNGKLSLAFNGSVIPLSHKHYDVFKGKPDGILYQGAPENDFQFQLSKVGAVDQLIITLEQGVDPIVFTRDNEIKLTPSDFAKYTGEFTLGPQAVSFVLRGTSLYALLPPQPDYELIPSAKDEFKLKIIDGYFVKFKTEKDGKFAEAAFVQPNGTFVAKRK